MEISHEQIIKSIESKKIKDRKEWEHLFILKHKFQGSVRRYLLSMGEFKEAKEFPVYGCGHRQVTILLDDNELSVVAYDDWLNSVGFRGNESKCWDCYCKDSQTVQEASP